MADMNINLARLDQAFDRLQAFPQRGIPWDARFRNLILTGTDDALNRINARVLSDEWGAPARGLLTWLIYASHVGLFDLNWESHCPHCTGLTHMDGHLGGIEHESHCNLCQVDFSTHADHNVEVTFSVSPSVRATQPTLAAFLPRSASALGVFDAAQPISYRFEEPGQYFLANAQGGIGRAPARLDVAPGSPTVPEVNVSFFPESVSPRLTALGPGQTAINVQGAPQVILLYRDPARLGAAPQVITALDVMLTPDFKDLFAQDALSQRESLSIKNLTVLFTDITGSTALYQRLGDVRAYNLVRDHFDVLFREVQNFKGVVVKTIGDAVMAAFPAPDLAVQAALAVQKNIREFNRPRSMEEGIILVKIGLHAGSAIAVNLNNTLDYFGNMVNLAARIQSKSRSEEVLISEEVYHDSAVQAALAADKSLILSNSVFELHGIGERRLYSIMSQ
jgi:class 3 adenylate cyclase